MFVVPLDNLWGSYGGADTPIEMENLTSVPVETPGDNNNYVFNDIATSFTLLVGIYFPSVTGGDLLRSNYTKIFFFYQNIQSFI